jgi:hypothetical protein
MSATITWAAVEEHLRLQDDQPPIPVDQIHGAMAFEDMAPYSTSTGGF